MNRSSSPLPNLEVWSQMMKDFNKAVKKASISNYNNNDKIANKKVKTYKKINICQTTIQSTEEKKCSTSSNTFKNNLRIKNKSVNSKLDVRKSLRSLKTKPIYTDSKTNAFSSTNNNKSIKVVKKSVQKQATGNLKSNSQLVHSLKTNKQKIIDDTSLLPIKHTCNKKKSNDEITSSVLLPKSTRSLKRKADVLISQSNAKGSTPARATKKIKFYTSTPKSEMVKIQKINSDSSKVKPDKRITRSSQEITRRSYKE